MVHSLSGISVISLSWKLAIAAGHHGFPPQQMSKSEALSESYTIRDRLPRELTAGAITAGCPLSMEFLCPPKMA
jgi:hypothetical protein